MESKSLNSTFRSISDIQEFELRVILNVVSLFSHFAMILQYFKNCHYFRFDRLSISFEMSEGIAIEFGT